MNDFTKDELIEIKRGIDALFEQRDFKDKPATLQFVWKIQSMIDNYCEHTYVFRCHDDTIYCPKCGELLQ